MAEIMPDSKFTIKSTKKCRTLTQKTASNFTGIRRPHLNPNMTK